MLNIDKALSLYSDKLAIGEIVDVAMISEQLPEAERQEFEELAEIVQLTMQLNETKEFEHFFEELNQYKERVYTHSKVANFQSEKGAQGNTDVIDRIFEDEFGDED